MDVTTRIAAKNSNVMIVCLAGSLDTVSAPATLPQIMAALEQSAAGLLMDLAAMEFISSAGISVLINVHKKAGAAGKQFGLFRAQPPVYKIFKITELDKVLKLFEEEEDAIQTLWPQA